MTVDPTGHDLKRLLSEETDPPSPCVMLNLLRFKEGGRDDYREYARQIVPFLERVGGELVYGGACSTLLVGPEAHTWDAVMLVRYPSRHAFLSMVADPEYQKITELRTSALEDAVLQATIPGSL